MGKRTLEFVSLGLAFVFKELGEAAKTCFSPCSVNLFHMH